ncbi:hypothetical protein [Treponema vincentii]|uniref:hypothetical protein n=1 Tax=Treponema vincentii TaxID=69710 RepID=UPI001E2E26B2|nr:hypothetical protein [Treponema vincentii]
MIGSLRAALTTLLTGLPFPTKTFVKKWPYYVIDGFIVSPNISIMSVETLDESFRYADHNPVKLRVTLNP